MRFFSPRALAIVALFAAASPAAAATDYYVSPTGNDAQAGTSVATAWQSLNRLNLVEFRPGDRILLEGGVVFAGTLTFDQYDQGTGAAPIVVTSYGAGRATINAGTGTAILIYNTSGIKIVNLSVLSSGRATSTGSGISAYTDLPGDQTLPFLHIESVNASGFGRNGIEVVSGAGASGFQDVTIKFVATWDNAMNGILTYAPLAGAHRNVYVGYSKSFNNPGIESSESTGNGIVLGGVQGAIVERNVVSGNGTGALGVHGPIGVWAYYSSDVRIQFNESFNNRTAGWADGGGFGLDVGVTNSTMQYNYSHGNDGAGLLLAGGFDAADHANNIVRYNISENDGRRNGFGSIQIWGKTRNTHIYNNTVVNAPDAGNEARAVKITNGYAEGEFPIGVSFRNNIFYTVGGVPNVIVGQSVLSGASVRFEHNNYYSTTGSPRIQWGDTTYTSVDSWARATGQEHLNGLVVGTSLDPMLGSPGGGPTLNDATRLTSMTAYRLRSGSPMIDTGLTLTSVGLGAVHDFYEGAVPQGSGFDVGAHEWTRETSWTPVPEVVLYAQDVTALSGAWSLAADASAAGGTKLKTDDLGWSSTSAPLASPTHYVDFTFTAHANTRYRFWVRLRAHADAKSNDSVFVQFSDALDASGAPVYRIGSSSGLTVNLAPCSTCALQGWGWQYGAYWLADSGDVWFPTTGTRTLRIQVREDGVALDQVVLSPGTYLTSAPGPTSGDATIVAKPTGNPPPPPPANTPPSVTLTAPTAGASFTAPASITVSAAASDADGSVSRVEFFAGSTLIGTRNSAPFSITWSNVPAGNYSLTAQAVDNAGASTRSSPVAVTVTAAAAPPDVVIYAADVASATEWSVINDATAAAGKKLSNADLGWSTTSSPLTAPTRFFDVTFHAHANIRYRVWLRLRAQGDVKWNDSVYVQFSDAVTSGGSPLYRIGTTAGLAINLATCGTCALQGWGWQYGAYWLNDTGDVWFPTTGSRTLRVQVREDGAEIDQIVLSPSTYLSAAPGSATNDNTIVAKPGGPPPPPANTPPAVSLTSPANGATYTAPASIDLAASASDSDGTIARVEFYAGTTLIGSREAAPYSVTWSQVAAGSYSLSAVAVDNAGASTRSSSVAITVSPSAATPPEVVIYAADVTASYDWSHVNDPTAAAGQKLSTVDAGWSQTSAPLAAPSKFFDVTFNAQANTRYRLWLRLRARGDSKWNDSVYVQFSDAVNSGGTAVYRIGTTAGLAVNLATCGSCALQGWGWQSGAYWLSDTGEVWFPTTGPRTIRVQLREDGVELDQIVLSPSRYLASAPGPPTNDRTVVPKP